MRLVEKSLAPLRARIDNAVARAVIRATAEGQGRLPRAQVEVLAGDVRDQRESLAAYGFCSRPLPGAEAVVVAVGGRANHTLIIATDDARYRLVLKPGEVALYDDQGQRVVLGRDGVSIATDQKLRLQAKEIEIHAEARLNLDAGGYGETWYPEGRDKFTQGAPRNSTKAIMPPEHAP